MEGLNESNEGLRNQLNAVERVRDPPTSLSPSVSLTSKADSNSPPSEKSKPPSLSPTWIYYIAISVRTPCSS